MYMLYKNRADGKSFGVPKTLKSFEEKCNGICSLNIGISLFFPR